MTAHHLFHLPGADVFPAADDNVFLAVDYGEIAIGVKTTYVAGVQPAIDNRPRGGVILVPVSAHALLGPHQDFAAVANGASPAQLICQRDLNRGHWPAHSLQQLRPGFRRQPMVFHRQERHAAGQFGHPVALAQPHVGLCQQTPQQGLWHGGCPVADGAHGTQVGGTEIGVIQQHRNHGRRQRHRRHLQLAAGLERGDRVKRLHQYDGGAVLVLQQHIVRRDVKQRERVQVPVSGNYRAPQGGGAQTRQERPVRQHRTLGPPGGAGGMQDPHCIIGARGRHRCHLPARQPLLIAGIQVDGGYTRIKFAFAQQWLQQAGIAKQGRNPCRLQLVDQLRRRKPGIEGHQYLAAGRHGIDQLQERRTVPRQYRHPLPRRAAGGQAGSQRHHALVQRRVGRGHTLPPQGGCPRPLCGLHGQHVMEFIDHARLAAIFSARPEHISAPANSFHQYRVSDSSSAEADMPNTGTSSAQGVTVAAG